MQTIDIDDDMFYNGSLASLIEAVTINKTEKHQQIIADTEDDNEKVEKYQRQTTNNEER